MVAETVEMHQNRVYRVYGWHMFFVQTFKFFVQYLLCQLLGFMNQPVYAP